MLPALIKYGTFALLIGLAAPASGAPPQKSGKPAAQVSKKRQSPPRKAKRRRTKRTAARVRPTSTLPLDSCAADRFTADQAALRTQIEQWLDVRYKRGGLSTKGVDCSGFLVRVYGDALRRELPRTSREQATVGARIGADDLAFGDLVFFRTRLRSKRISHVGIYIGDDQFVHASRHAGVSVDRLSSTYYARRFMMARRVLGAPEQLNE